MTLWDTDYNYTNADLDDIREDGVERGKSIANNVAIEDMPRIGEGDITTEDDVKDEFMSKCADAEENNRQFTPFEFIAKEINEREDADDAWSEFDDGIQEGFDKVWEECVIQVTEEYAKERAKEEMDEIYGSFDIAGSTYSAGQILENVDPINLDQIMNDWADSRGWEIDED